MARISSIYGYLRPMWISDDIWISMAILEAFNPLKAHELSHVLPLVCSLCNARGSGVKSDSGVFQENYHLNQRDLERIAVERHFLLLIHACRCLQGTRDWWKQYGTHS